MEALQIAQERKEVKGNGERERYTQMNAEFQRIGRTDKKAFFSEQCQEMEANIEWERLAISQKQTNKHKKTWRYQFHAKMGTIKDRNGMDLTEAEDIKKS